MRQTTRSVAQAAAILGAIACGAPALAQRSWIAVCPLSEPQSRASVAAFAKIVPTLNQEPRCTNCHGGLDPTTSPIHPSVDLPSADNPGDDCTFCHDNVVNKTNGEESRWHLAPKFLEFINKSDQQLCEQLKGHAEGPCSDGSCGPWPMAEKFLGHMTDDEGGDNFTATAFAGTKGLSDHPIQKPRITHAELLALGHAWTDVTDGEWQGSRDCGCAPTKYALRVSAVTTIPGDDFRVDMLPVDIPIEFEDDGTFKGDSAVQMRGIDPGECIATSSASTRLVATGKAVQTWRERTFDVTIQSAQPTTSQASAHCPEGTMSRSFTASSRDVWKVKMQGTVGEVVSFAAPSPAPAVRITARVEIVKLP